MATNKHSNLQKRLMALRANLAEVSQETCNLSRHPGLSAEVRQQLTDARDPLATLEILLKPLPGHVVYSGREAQGRLKV